MSSTDSLGSFGSRDPFTPSPPSSDLSAGKAMTFSREGSEVSKPSSFTQAAETNHNEKNQALGEARDEVQNLSDQIAQKRRELEEQRQELRQLNDKLKPYEQLNAKMDSQFKKMKEAGMTVDPKDIKIEKTSAQQFGFSQEQLDKLDKDGDGNINTKELLEAKQPLDQAIISAHIPIKIEE